MGFPIDLPLGKGVTINYLLCIIALIASTFSTFSRVQNFILTLHSLSEKVELFFFWRKCSTVVAVGVQTSFLQPPAPLKRGYCKKCDRKKQQQGGLCGSRQKDRASPEVRGAGIFGGWGFCPGGAVRNKLSGET